MHSLAVVIPTFNEPIVTRTLEALRHQNLTNGVHHFAVDNGSTDATREQLDIFAKEHPDFPLTILDEAQKGTGAAADTGYRRAIDLGHAVVARTDGDSLPAPDWTTRIADTFERKKSVKLLGGKSLPIHDEAYRRGDDLLMPLAVRGARIALAVRHLDHKYVKAVVGHNMATRATAYEQVGGFDRTAIDEQDEDIAYSLKIARAFGTSAILIDPELTVATSMRRVRRYGIAGTALHHLFPGTRKLRSEIDVR